MGNSTTPTFWSKNDGKFYSFHFFVKISMIFCLESLLMHFQLFLRNAHCKVILWTDEYFWLQFGICNGICPMKMAKCHLKYYKGKSHPSPLEYAFFINDLTFLIRHMSVISLFLFMVLYLHPVKKLHFWLQCGICNCKCPPKIARCHLKY